MLVCPECGEYVLCYYCEICEQCFLVEDDGSMDDNECDKVQMEDDNSPQIVCDCGNAKKYYEVDENSKVVRKAIE